MTGYVRQACDMPGITRITSYNVCYTKLLRYIIFIPVFVFLLLPFCMVLIGETKGFLHATGTLHWGLMISYNFV